MKRRWCTFAPTSNNLLLEIYLRWHAFSQIYFYSFIQNKGHWVLYYYRKFGTIKKYAKHDSNSAIASPELITDVFCSIIATSWVSPEEKTPSYGADKHHFASVYNPGCYSLLLPNSLTTLAPTSCNSICVCSPKHFKYSL